MEIHSCADSPAPKGALAGSSGTECIGKRESARIWRPNAVPGLELLHGSYRHFSFTRHFHDTVAFGVVESGAMKTYWQHAIHLTPAGTAILFNPGEVHAPQAAGATSWSFRMFYLDQALLQKLSESLEQKRSLLFVRPFVQNPELFATLLRLHEMFESYRTQLESESLLLLGLAQIAQYSPLPINPAFSAASRIKLKRACDYLEAYCHQNVTLSKLAEIVGLSAYHLVRSFRDQIGITPHAYLMQARIERGRTLLRAGTSISETALQTGFVDQSHFTRQFKRFTGVTPGRYQAAFP